MRCYHPLKAFRTATGVVFQELGRYDIIGDIELPCGRCIGCRWRRAQDDKLRCMHEAAMWPQNCVVALTYARDQLPPGGNLCHEDFQKFMRRMRKAGYIVRYFMCGEYGPLNMRPHYHASLFNVDFRADRVEAGKSRAGQVFYESKTLNDLWSHGRCSVQDFLPETAGYVTQYIMKKQLGRESEYRHPVTGELLVPEYSRRSLRPGIGQRWFELYGESDVLPGDFVVAGGSKNQTPRYYDKLAKRSDLVDPDELAYKRSERAARFAADNTPERLAVAEKVHEARLREHKREFSDD